MPSIRAVQVLPLLFLPAMAHAAGDACQMELAAPTPVRVGVLAPVAAEFAPALTQLGSADGVLAQSFDEALSVDNVLARIRIDGCRTMLRKAAPVVAQGAPDPAAYTPKTAFDNTPWRFNMTQNGKRMTADEFDAWMKARGVRVVGKKEPGADAAPAAAAPEK